VFSPTDDLMALDGPPLELWDVARASRRTTIPEGGVVVGFSADGKRVAVLGASIAIFSLEKAVVERVIPAMSSGQHRQPAVEVDGHWWLLLVADDEAGRRVLAIDLAQPDARLFTLLRPAGALPQQQARVALSADGKILALADPDGLWLWDVADKTAPRRLPGQLRPADLKIADQITDVVFSRSGKYLLIGVGHTPDGDISKQRGEVITYDVASRSAVATQEVLGKPLRVAFSPDEHAVAAVIPNCGTVLYCHD
jgi:hypothetical protein